MILSLTKDPTGKPNLCEVPSENVIYLHFSTKYRMTVFHTVDALYYGYGPLEFWCDGLKAIDGTFAIVDRGIMAHVSLITYVDQKNRIAYFEDMITAASKRCTISKPNWDILFEKLNLGRKAGPPI